MYFITRRARPQCVNILYTVIFLTCKKYAKSAIFTEYKMNNFILTCFDFKMTFSHI